MAPSTPIPNVCLVRQQPALRTGDLWFTYLAGMAPIYCLWVVGIWAPAMFLEIGVKELGRSSLLSSLLGVSAIPGLLTSEIISDRLAGRGEGRKGLAALILLAMAVAMFLMGVAVATRAQPIALALLVFVAGCCIWGVWAPVFALLADITPARLRGTSFGLNNTINFIGSLVAPIATGWILETVTRALAARGQAIPLYELERRGIRKVLDERGLRQADLGLKGCTLIYRRRVEDMPLAEIPEGATPSQVEKTRTTRRKLLQNFTDKYLLTFRDREVPVGYLAEGNHLAGLRVAASGYEEVLADAATEAQEKVSAVTHRLTGQAPLAADRVADLLGG